MKRREGIVSVLCICGLCVDPIALTRDKRRCEVVAILAADRESSRIVFTHINPHCLLKSEAQVGKVGKKREVDDGEETAASRLAGDSTDRSVGGVRVGVYTSAHARGQN